MNLFIIGDRLSTVQSNVEKALSERDSEFIKQEAHSQVQAGANMLNLNIGTVVENKLECIEWMINNIREVVDVPLSIESTNPEVIRAALDMLNQEETLIHSISLERERWDSLIGILKETKCRFVGLCMDDRGAVGSWERRYRLARELISRLDDENISRERLFIDPVVLPASVDHKGPLTALKALEKIKENYPEIKTIAELNAVSYGLPQRRLINRNYIALLLRSGLDAARLDPLDKELMANILTVEMLLGKDDFCAKFLEAELEGFFEGI